MRDIMVEVGQVWEYGNDGKQYKIIRRHERGCGWRVGDGPGDHFSDSAFGAPGRYGLTLISPAPPACKAPEWCGYEIGTSTNDTRVRAFIADDNYPPGTATERNGHRYCSESCASKPPVASKAPDRSLCKGWCGKQYANADVPCRGGGVPMFMTGHDGTEITADVDLVWCSPACRDARLPPVGVPGGTGDAKCGCNHVHVGLCGGGKSAPYCSDCGAINPTECRCKPAPAATPAKQDAVCFHAKKRDMGDCSGPLRRSSIGCRDTVLDLCDRHIVLREQKIEEQMMFERSGVSMMAKLPERLPRPLMARDEMQESDCLEDA